MELYKSPFSKGGFRGIIKALPPLPPLRKGGKYAVASFEFCQIIFFGQFQAFLVRQGFHVGLPARTPVGVPSPQPAQQRPGVFVVSCSETARGTAGFCHGLFSSVHVGCALRINTPKCRVGTAHQLLPLNEPDRPPQVPFIKAVFFIGFLVIVFSSRRPPRAGRVRAGAPRRPLNPRCSHVKAPRRQEYYIRSIFSGLWVMGWIRSLTSSSRASRSEVVRTLPVVTRVRSTSRLLTKVSPVRTPRVL
jgi:hypothetical protein